MWNPLYNLFWGIGGILGIIAALMAYLITYNEWTHHFPTKKEPKKMAWEAAEFTFIVFFLIAFVSGYVFLNYINK